MTSLVCDGNPVLRKKLFSCSFLHPSEASAIAAAHASVAAENSASVNALAEAMTNVFMTGGSAAASGMTIDDASFSKRLLKYSRAANTELEEMISLSNRFSEKKK